MLKFYRLRLENRQQKTKRAKITLQNGFFIAIKTKVIHFETALDSNKTNFRNLGFPKKND
ncbi:hypothetical protein ADICYQ_2598 [Cyclobacterium qasimii M12-11B]|uniref:Uncharacterized protein n=1 Tax=Cyclobacterium qasimii M12-11B TaxID=641524 RepID=S7VFT1_9BACT|nr:hypothetical protein ADICYQ_2598 [Cyclobacterium qasimii M12-11B]